MLFSDLKGDDESAAILGFNGKCPPDVTLILRPCEVELGNKLVDEIIDALLLMFKQDVVVAESSIDERLP